MPSFFAALRSALARGAAEPLAPVREASAPATLRLRASVYSDAGPVRTCNEDRARCVLEDAGALGERVGLVVVADGMGGHQAGEIAAQTAVDAMADAWRTRGAGDSADAVLRRAIRDAGAAVYAAARTRPDWEGMGTTITAVAFTGDAAVVGHIGDTRAYLYRDGAIRRLTEDDTLVNHLVRSGVIAPQQVQDHPDRGVLSQALGTRAEPIEIHIGAPIALCDGDLLLVCSDGLHDVLSDARLERELAVNFDRRSELAALAAHLAQTAFAAGTKDNVSIALVAAGGGGSTRDPLRPTRSGEIGAETPS